jgi:glyoxylase-like metal-dependent hydrolase (beta-lactamase superfamily II)
VQGRIHLIGGAGSNIAVEVSDEGTLLVDSGDSAAADKVIAEIKQLQIRPVRWIMDTDADLDHTGGNGTSAKTGVASIAPGGVAAPGGGGGAFYGEGARLIAYQNVLNRMSAPTGQRSSREVAEWPTDTFSPRGRTSRSAASRSRGGTCRPRTATATSWCSSADRT